LNEKETSEQKNPFELIIRKSRPQYIVALIVTLSGLGAIFYIAAEDIYNIGPIHFVFLLVFLLFSFLTFKALIDRTAQIKINHLGIKFSGDNFLLWNDISKVDVEKKHTEIGRGIKIERSYLNIHLSKNAIVKSFEISGLDLSPKEILQSIELFRG
jgi:hypothetical protein